jgi:hypothetical protein
MNPKHYSDCLPNWEPIDVIERYGLGFHLGNALKYIVRCKRKGEYISDLRKALYYVTRHKLLDIWMKEQYADLDVIEYEKLHNAVIEKDVFRLKDETLQDIAHGIILADSDIHILIHDLIYNHEESSTD